MGDASPAFALGFSAFGMFGREHPGGSVPQLFPRGALAAMFKRGRWLVGSTVGPASPNRTTRLHLISAVALVT